jgi:tRNA pseudouridine13 synthase
MTAADPIAEQPRLLANFQPAAGVIKEDYEDFLVEEVPLYAASGEGTHTYFLLEKRGLSTMQAVHDIARALNVRRRDIGYAGLKDARAVTRQWMSVEHVSRERLEDLQLARMRVLQVTSHTNKLRLGHLRGNTFVIKVRQTEPQRLAELQDALATLAEKGVPNYFGQQRFGGRGDAWETGRAVVHGDLAEALDLILGRPNDRDHGSVRRARQLYELGKYTDAARAWPGMFRDERRALKTLQRTGGKKKRGFLAIDASLRKFYVSAYQSYLFNCVVASRLRSDFHRILPGDLAWLHANGAVFEVVDEAVEQPRTDAFEISATGPLFGYRMTPATGRPGKIEADLLAAEGLTPESFRAANLRIKGGRRPLRFRPTDALIRLGADARGTYLELWVTLPRGCYATSLLRELFVSPTVTAEVAGEARGTG